MSQREAILTELKRGKPVTPISALRDFQCFRLAARIMEIRDSGQPVEMTWVKRGDSRYARYFINSKKA